MSTGQQQAAQTATAAAILSEEKTYYAVQFAITGVADADFLSGVAALIIQLKLANQLRLQQRLFEFLAATAKDEADKVEEQQRTHPGHWEAVRMAAQQYQVAQPHLQSYGSLGCMKPPNASPKMRSSRA